MIYGANAGGVSLAASVRASSRYRLVGFVDADAAVKGQMLAGVPIYEPDALAALAQSRSGRRSLPRHAARPAGRERLAAISTGARAGPGGENDPRRRRKSFPAAFTVSDIRPIEVADLLRRDPVEPIDELIREAVEGRSILVTGAGGSIGSEICRQAFRARRQSWSFSITASSRSTPSTSSCSSSPRSFRTDARAELVPIVGSMMNERFVRRIIAEHGIDTLFHAAAYKHVPLLEDNELAGVDNNVFGTLAVVRAAFDAKLSRFTMISTDKAVRPKSVMGASKRVAELIVQAYADRLDCSTQFAIVRFGNVLDSSGSVVQRFRSQIRAGGPDHGHPPRHHPLFHVDSRKRPSSSSRRARWGIWAKFSCSTWASP